MSAHQIFRLRNQALLMALAAVFPVLSYAASAANVDFTVGNVTAVNAVGVQRPLTKGAEISNGDTIRTGDGGRAQVRFSDGAMVSLQPETDFRVDDYQYSGKTDGQEKGFFSLLKGGLRTITGLVGRSNRDNYKVTTAVATIGIRGTEYTGALTPGSGELVVNTGEGLVEVCNGAGCLVLAPGESGTVTGPNSNPRRTDSRPQLSPAQPGTGSQQTFSSGENRNADGTPAGLVSMLTGTQTYSTAFATNGPKLDSGSGTGTINSSGILTSFTYSAGYVADANEASGNTVEKLGNDGLVAWGKWNQSGDSFGDVGCCEGVLHYVTGIPTRDSQVSLGSTGTYTLLGGGVTGNSTGAGSITSASMTVNFIAAQVTSLAVGMNVGGNSYNLTDSSNPTISGFGTAPLFSSSSAQVSGGGCSGTCSAYVSGAFFGAGAARAGVAFKFYDGQYIAGAAALKK